MEKISQNVDVFVYFSGALAAAGICCAMKHKQRRLQLYTGSGAASFLTHFLHCTEQ